MSEKFFLFDVIFVQLQQISFFYIKTSILSLVDRLNVLFVITKRQKHLNIFCC